MDVVTVDYDRAVHAPTETSRRTVLEALRQMSFKIDQSQGAVIQAHRGGIAGAKFGGQGRLRVSVTVTPDSDSGSRIHVRVGDAERAALNTTDACAVYGPLFVRVQTELDGWLCALDPQLKPDAMPQLELHPDHTPTMKEHLGGIARHLPGSWGKSAAHKVLGDVHLWVMAPDASAVLDPDDAQTCLTVAALVSADPSALPPALRAQIGDLTVALRDALTDARPPAGRLDIGARDKKAVDFLYQQSRIRGTLPVREVFTCRDCGLERIVNPDFQEKASTIKALQNATGLMGVTVGTSGINAFVVVGKLLNLSALSPPTPCRRCEGIDADVSLATICPKCKTIRRDAVLTTCPQAGCGYDFRARAAGVSLWNATSASTPAPAAAPAAATEASTPAAAPPAGWYADPSGRHRLRWFDGDWSRWATDVGPAIDDPLVPEKETA